MYDELCEDLDEKEIKNGSGCFNKNMDETLSLSISREEGFQDMVDDSTDDCIAVDALYVVSDAPNILDLKDEIVVEEYFSSILQKVPHDVFSPKIEEKDQDVTCFFLQDKRILVSPIYD